MKNLILITISVFLVALGLLNLTNEKQTAKFTEGLICSQVDSEMTLVKKQNTIYHFK